MADPSVTTTLRPLHPNRSTLRHAVKLRPPTGGCRSPTDAHPWRAKLATRLRRAWSRRSWFHPLRIASPLPSIRRPTFAQGVVPQWPRQHTLGQQILRLQTDTRLLACGDGATSRRSRSPPSRSAEIVSPRPRGHQVPKLGEQSVGAGGRLDNGAQLFRVERVGSTPL